MVFFRFDCTSSELVVVNKKEAGISLHQLQKTPICASQPTFRKSDIKSRHISNPMEPPKPRSPFANGASLRDQLDSAALAIGRAAANEEAAPGQEALETLLADSCEHTEHMEASLASTGCHMASLQRDVLPNLLANAKHLHSLYAAIDAMEAQVVPAVEASLTRMEAEAERLEKERAALEPSVATRIFASFFGSAATSEAAEAREPWSHPKVFDTEELLRILRNASDGVTPRGGTATRRVDAADVSGPSIAGYEIRRPDPSGGGELSVALVGAKVNVVRPSNGMIEGRAGVESEGYGHVDEEHEHAGDDTNEDDEGEMVI